LAVDNNSDGSEKAKMHWHVVCIHICVLDMLKLASQKRCQTAASTVTPDVIMLRDGFMTFGRSYKAHIKLMMPYISRKHFSVSTVLCPNLSI